MLKYIGFSEGAISLLSNYLQNRQQCVVIDNNLSDYISIKSGVPQGSILGPLLFSIYSTHLVKSLQHCKFHLYADDTQLYYSFPFDRVEIACETINADLDAFIKTATDHCLIINSSKSNVILFGPENNKLNVSGGLNIKINNVSLTVVNEVKNLGVWLDTNLRFEKHVNQLIRCAYSKLKIIYGNRYFLPFHVKVKLCESLVLSIFNYASSVYGPHLTIQYKKKIQKVQNSCLRLIYGIRRQQRISYKLREIEWLNMENRRLLHTLSLFHRIIVTKKPPYLHRKITYRTDVHNINIRDKGLLSIPSFNTEFFRRSFGYQICHLYNQLPNNLIKLNITRFKPCLKLFLLNKQN